MALAALSDGAKVDKKKENICIARVKGMKRPKIMYPAPVYLKNPNPKMTPAT